MKYFAYSLEQLDMLFDKAVQLGLLRSSWFKVNNNDYYEDYKRCLNKRKKLLRQLRNKQIGENDGETYLIELAANKEDIEYIENIIKDNLLKQIFKSDFKLKLKKEHITSIDKDVYTSEDNAASFFICKIINDEFRKSFKLLQPNRTKILKSLCLLLSESVDKMIVRCDIKKFFESIPREKLLYKIESAALLNNKTIKIIKAMFFDLQSNYNLNSGVPRGISFSPALADLYMRSVDNEIENLPGVYFYRRYVDDMLIIASPSAVIPNAAKLFESVCRCTEAIGLELHKKKDSEKCEIKDIKYGVEGLLSFDYLGYNINLNKSTSELSIRLRNSRVLRYMQQIDEVIRYYKSIANRNIRRGGKAGPNRRNQPLTILYKLLAYLTCNYHLGGYKHEILSGIYFKHEMLTDTSQLRELDVYLERAILNIDTSIFKNLGKSDDNDNESFSESTYWENVKKVIFCKYSFERGYCERRMCHLSSSDFKMIKHIFKKNEAQKNITVNL